MITSDFDQATVSGRIVLRPNRSWTWRANTYFVGTLLIISLAIATAFTARGMWVILPFTVLEMSVLLACLYYCVRRTHLQEVLIFSPESLVLERGVNRPQLRVEFQRYFTRFFVRGPRHPWYRQRIALRCRDQEMEIGSFLSGDEKEDLIRQLREMIHRLEAAPGVSAAPS